MTRQTSGASDDIHLTPLQEGFGNTLYTTRFFLGFSAGTTPSEV
jgi:hypothetical protein